MKRSLCLAVVVVFLVSCFHSSDKVLEARFRENYGQFSELVEMLERDRGVRVLGEDDVFYDPGYSMLTAEQLSAYRALMRQLGLVDITRDNDNSLNLNTSYGGLFLRTSGKGYHFSKKTIEGTVSSLDQIINSDRGDTKTVYKHLEGSWYLSYESW